jgi:dTDP-4-dehydrorhamnose 3,5-epimerase
MFNLSYLDLGLEGLKLIKYGKFRDERGYFTEHFRLSQLNELSFMNSFRIMQTNESYSKKGVFRGFHYQYDKPMGKLIRVINGHILDFALDIRRSSPTYGHVEMVELKHSNDSPTGEWFWLPAGFAHACYFLEDSVIEYYCDAEYNNEGEGAISPLAKDINWSYCNKDLLRKIDWDSILLTEKDRNGFNCNEVKVFK